MILVVPPATIAWDSSWTPQGVGLFLMPDRSHPHGSGSDTFENAPLPLAASELNRRADEASDAEQSAQLVRGNPLNAPHTPTAPPCASSPGEATCGATPSATAAGVARSPSATVPPVDAVGSNALQSPQQRAATDAFLEAEAATATAAAAAARAVAATAEAAVAAAAAAGSEADDAAGVAAATAAAAAQATLDADAAADRSAAADAAAAAAHQMAAASTAAASEPEVEFECSSVEVWSVDQRVCSALAACDGHVLVQLR